jgi:type II secretion system protein N
MNNIKIGFLYIAYILSVMTFFLFYLFPTETVKKYISFTLTRTHPALNVTMEKITPAFPPGVKFQAVEFYHRNALLLKAEQIKIAPYFLSFFGSAFKFAFKARAYKGTLTGQGEFASKQPDSRVAVDARLTGIQIKEISAIRDLTGRKITGLLNGKVTYDKNGRSDGNLSAGLTLSDCMIELLTPVFDLENVSFGKIEADVALSNQTLRLKQCVFAGGQMDGTISGLISLKTPLRESVINLSGKMTPHPLLLANVSKVFPGNKNKLKQNSLPIRLGGTFDRPAFFFQ